MHAIDGYFSDELIKCDTNHQVQALIYACETREDEPLVITEVPGLLSTMRLISSYLCMDQRPLPLVPPGETLAAVFGCDELEGDIFSFELELPQEFEPWLLLEPLTALLESLIGDGVFYNSQEHLCALPQFSDFLSEIARIYLLDLPRLLLCTSRLSLATRRDYVLCSVSSCLSLFALLTRSSAELLARRNPPDEYKSDFTIYKAVPLEDVLQAFLGSCCAILHDFVRELNRFTGFGEEFVQTCHVQTLYFIECLTAKAAELHVELDYGVMRGLIDYVISQVAGDICQRRQVLALTILQRIEFTQESCDQQLLAHVLSEALFKNGYLKVRSQQIAQSQLAILALIERASRTLGQFVIYLCEDLEFAIEDNFVYNRFQKREETLPCDGEASSDDEESNEHAYGKEQSPPRQADTQIPPNPEDPFRSRSPSPGIRVLESEDSEPGKQENEAESVAFQITKPAFTPANFVVHFLLEIVQNYGNGIPHSTRNLQLHLHKPSENDAEIHKNIPDGHKVNYQALNTLSIAQVQQMDAEYEEKLRQLHTQDEIAIEQIRKSTKYDNISKARVYAAQEQFEQRDRKLRKEFLLAKAKIGREAFGTKFAADETYRSTLVMRQTQLTATQIKNRIDPQYELFYIRYALQIIANICLVSRNSPSRQVKLALQQMDAGFINGLLEFVAVPEATAAALQLVFAILTFPSGNTRVYEILVANGLFDSLCQVNANNSTHAATFICRLLGADQDIKLSVTELAQLVEQTINSFIGLFCRFEEQNLSEFSACALKALAYLTINYAIKVGPVNPIVDGDNFTKLIDQFLMILTPRQHHFQYYTALTLYGIFGLPRRLNVSRLCYDTGVFKAVIALCEMKFEGEFKLQPVDLVFIRMLTDVIEYADDKIQKFAQTQTTLQECFCKCYRLWESSLNMRPYDDYSKAVLPGSELFQPPAVVPRGNVFEVENYGGETAARTSSRLMQHSRLSPSRQRVNLIDAENKIRNNEEDNVVLPEQVMSEGDELAQFMNLSQDARYLLHCNFTTTFLAFFRALYPGLSNHFTIINTAVSDKSKMPSTGRLSVHRPSSGMTPKIGMKIPIVLPNLAMSSKTTDGNTLDVYVDSIGCLTILEAQAESLKESLLTLQTGLSDDFVASDRNFLENAIDVLTDRIEVIRRSGLALESGLAKGEIASEAQFMALID